MDNLPQKRVYGRRQGRPLNASRQEAIERLLPLVSIDMEILTEKGDLTPSSLFDVQFRECWFEIGFGAGEHLSALMRRHPDIAWIGAEPYINGMSSFLKDISPLLCHSGESRNPKDKQTDPAFQQVAIASKDTINVRVLMDDAMMVAHSLTDNSLDGIYVLNPDPWHKTRHHKRRIIRQDNLDCFARILKQGGQLIMSTDVPDLADWMVTQATMHDAFEWDALSANDWRTPPQGWVHTAYEGKRAKNGEEMVYLFFQRK